jgi:hypothetical protein
VEHINQSPVSTLNYRYTCILQAVCPQVPEEAGPQAGDPSSVHYPYFSTVDYVTDQYSGLMGVVMVARQGTLTAQGAPQISGPTAAEKVARTVLSIQWCRASFMPSRP